MESIIQMLAPLLIVILISVLTNSRRKAQQQRTERAAEAGTGDTAMQQDDTAQPPFMSDFPFATELEQMMAEQSEAAEQEIRRAEEDSTAADTTPEPPAETPAPEPPPIPVESPRGIRPVPGTALLTISPATFRQGIILSEILGPPKTRRQRIQGR